ncbi:MAG: hypothetical protein JWN34_1005, partial [Bryobacterales bacterium]|nr:hypothetical protein [Bryobacterales bacterium]
MGGALAAAFGFYVTRTRPVTANNASVYVDAARCQSCHPAIHNSYQQVGMARAFASTPRVSALEG